MKMEVHGRIAGIFFLKIISTAWNYINTDLIIPKTTLVFKYEDFWVWMSSYFLQ